jgi:uncharacterized surface protein with fasciclin (FAS1) repeats
MDNNQTLVGIVVAVAVVLGGGYYLYNSSTAMEPVQLPLEESAPAVVEPMPVDPMEEESMTNTIVDVAMANGDFTTLVSVVKQAGLAETLSGDGPYTVFAPTDTAFAAVPEETLNALLADNAQLTDVLTYHVVEGKVMAADVVNLTSATTVNGQDITITVTEEGVMLNDSVMVTITDIEASNGVIHVIDAVLMPSEDESTDSMDDAMMDSESDDMNDTEDSMSY